MKARFLAVATLLCAVAAFAQTGTISGKIVTVSGGNPVPEVKIHVKNTTTDASFAAQSAASGNYAVSGLPPGNYELVTEFPMFMPFRQKDIPVQAGQTARIDIQLSDMQLNTLGDGGDDFVKLVTERPAPVGPTPRMPDGKPDFNGVWLAAAYHVDGDPAQPLPWADEIAKKRRDRLGIDSPGAHCLPN
jgi:hypothetical protein